MPPEPLPWDRKDFVFKDRKHHRITSGDGLSSATFGGGGGNFNPRWRDPYHFPRASPRRPPPSYHRQNGSYYQLFDDSNGHGCTPSRSDDGFRSSNGRYNEGRSNSRERRGSFRRSPYCDGYVPSQATSQRSVAVPITSPPSPLKDLQDKNSASAADQRSDLDRDRDHSLGSLGWNPLKWSRQGSISSSKAVRSEVEEFGNGSLEVSLPNLGKEMPVRSPVSSPAPLDDGVPKKKPRLTWGQGLANYEKQKVEGSSNSGKDQVSESSPKVMGMAGSMSPVTPCSAACSSPGAGGRPFSKATNVDNDTSHHSETSVLGLQNCSEELPIKLDHLPLISKLTSLLNDLLQPEDACTGDSTSMRNTALNKLLLFKADISKELEKTECEIDLLENDLKSLSNAGKSDPIQNSLALQADTSSIPLSESASVSSKMSLDITWVIYSATTAGEEPVIPICSSGEHALEVRHPNNDIPQTTCSNDGESTPSGNEEPMFLDLRENEMAGNGSGNSNHIDGESSGANADLVMSSHEKRESKFIALIMASNKDAAKKASQVFDGALTTAQQQFDIWGSDRMLLCRKNDVHVREQLALQKHQLKFKERVLTLKFRAFHHLWKEDLRLLSVRKQLPKSQKRFELSSRSSQSSSQKHRSSIRSRFTLPAGNLTLVPTADIVDFTSKLLSDSQIKLYRKDLKMPVLILDEKDRRYSRFVTNNNLIEDPPSFEKERSMINPWTQEEKGVFMEMLATFGKDFARISSFLSHKKMADCIEFYYKNHKLESFRDVKKQLDLRKQWRCLSANTTYLVTSGKKWNREANAASPVMLGAVPVAVAVANNNGTSRNQQKYAGRSVVPSYHNLKALRGSYSSVERAHSIEISGNEKEPTGTDALAGMHGALSSKAVSSCVTSSFSPPEKMIFVRVARPLTPEVTQTIEEEATCSDEGCGELGSVDWTDVEKSMFIRSLGLYGKDFARISESVGTKSSDQCKIFFSKGRKCLSLDQIHPGAGNGSTPISNANGGRSDADDACAAEMDSAICSTQSCSRTDVDFIQSVANTGVEGSVHVGNASLQTEIDRSSEQYDVGGSHQEEVDGLESVPRVEKLETERVCVQPRAVEGMGDAAIKHIGLVPQHDGAESTMDRELVEVVVGGEVGKVDTGVEGSVHVGNTSLRTEIDRSSEQYDMGGSHQEEIDDKVDGLESVLRVEKLETERRECVQPIVVEGMDDAALKHSGLVPWHDGAESTMDRELGEVVSGEVGKVDNGISVSLAEPSTALCIEGKQLKPEITVDVQQGGIPEGKSPAVGVKNEVEFEQILMVSETGSGERKWKIDTGKINGIDFSLAAESTDKEIDSDNAPRMNACPKRVFSFSSHQDPMPMELLSCSQIKPQMSSKQDHAHSLPLSTLLADPSSICSEGSFHVPSQPTINFNEHLHKLRQGSGTNDFYQQCLLRINLNQMDQSSYVLSGYPVQVMNQQESKRETSIITEKPILRESHSMENLGSQLNQYFVPDVHNEKIDASVASNSRSGMLVFQRIEDASDSQLRPCSMNSCQETEEQSIHRTGDVKLFGQILTNPSSQQKANPSSQDTDSQPLSPKQKKPAIAKMSTSRTDISSSIFPLRPECIDQSNLEDVPLQSYGYWDGHHIQTGFSSLPESTIMLTAYQGPVTGTPFLSAKDSGVSSNGAALNYHQAYVQPLSAKGKCLDSFPEMQKRRNGFELVSGFQQRGRTAMARLDVNMAGRSRGILVGGSGVSDPVAALKMTKLYTREMETWTPDNGR